MNTNNDPTDLISKLKFIGRIKQNEKINTKYLYTQDNNYATSLSRSLLYQDTRENLIIFLNDIISKGIYLIKDYSSAREIFKKKLCLNIFNDLIESKKGINNLIITYKNDTMLGCRLSTLIQQIESKEYEFEKLLKRQNIIISKTVKKEHDIKDINDGEDEMEDEEEEEDDEEEEEDIVNNDRISNKGLSDNEQNSNSWF